ncbi:hypothetical protein CANCADRAFT_56745 [Tortispora caseinolytica NRRL Y-17796]|uniref:DUF3020 domain-containing protein n=1 Tax=Tortispora caseinolytica NRRL Y-17796 TaxID=767744 RepID=A0A1E4TES6_9ASCO|nr:hypothetical protein CANCADRAFT_56745 [Tortispora caseinolytica NRRL Y-17796]
MESMNQDDPHYDDSTLDQIAASLAAADIPIDALNELLPELNAAQTAHHEQPATDQQDQHTSTDANQTAAQNEPDYDSIVTAVSSLVQSGSIDLQSLEALEAQDQPTQANLSGDSQADKDTLDQQETRTQQPLPSVIHDFGQNEPSAYDPPVLGPINDTHMADNVTPTLESLVQADPHLNLADLVETTASTQPQDEQPSSTPTQISKEDLLALLKSLDDIALESSARNAVNLATQILESTDHSDDAIPDILEMVQVALSGSSQALPSALTAPAPVPRSAASRRVRRPAPRPSDEGMVLHIRNTNRIRKQRWRQLHAERNLDNDLRVRVIKRAGELFGNDSSEAKEQWIQSEFERRREKRLWKQSQLHNRNGYRSGSSRYTNISGNGNQSAETDIDGALTELLSSSDSQISQFVNNMVSNPELLDNLTSILLRRQNGSAESTEATESTDNIGIAPSRAPPSQATEVAIQEKRITPSQLKSILAPGNRSRTYFNAAPPSPASVLQTLEICFSSDESSASTGNEATNAPVITSTMTYIPLREVSPSGALGFPPLVTDIAPTEMAVAL